MRLIGLEIPRNQTKALRLRTSVDHTVSQSQEKSPPQKKPKRKKDERKTSRKDAKAQRLRGRG
jgi:hypothetical protein